MRKFFDFFGVGREWREVCVYWRRLALWERCVYVWTMVSVAGMLCFGECDAAWPWLPLNCLVSMFGFMLLQMRHEGDDREVED